MASSATAPMTPFVPGAGPPPTRMPIRLMDMARALRRRRTEVLEATPEFTWSQARRFGKPVDPGGVREILGLEPNHVGASDSKSFARHVDQADLCLATLVFGKVVERNRHQP